RLFVKVVAVFAAGFTGAFGEAGARGAGGPDFFLELGGDLGILLEEQPGLFLALAELHLAVAESGAGAADDLFLDAHVEDVAVVAVAVGVHHVELGHAEGRGDLVLDDLRPHALADDFFAFFQLADAADINAAAGVELQRAAAGR